MNRFIKVFPILLFLYLISAVSVLGITFTITDSPSSISSDPFSVTASISGNLSGTNYLRIDLFKENTTNYFGETFNNSSWYGESDGTGYFPITYENSVWSGSLQGRIGSPTATKYPGPGEYKLRIRRYTSVDNYTVSDIKNITINWALPTATPTETPIPTETFTPQNTPTPTKTPTPKPTTKIVNTPTSTPKLLAKEQETAGQVLGQQQSVNPSSSSSDNLKETTKQGLITGAKISLVLGLLFCGIAIMVFTQRMQQLNKKNEEN